MGPAKVFLQALDAKIVLIPASALVLSLTGGCGGDCPGFEPAPGVSGLFLLKNQSNHSGVLVRLAPLDSVTVTDASGRFSFSEIPEGRWRVEANYPFFEKISLEVTVDGGLQRNAVGGMLRQLLRFWVELPDTLVSFCKCDYRFDVEMNCYVENLTESEVDLASPSSPMEDFAVIQKKNGIDHSPAWEFCESYTYILPGELDVPDFVRLGPRETRRFDITGSLLTECFEQGRYVVFWALADESHHREHFRYSWLELNGTLFEKPELLEPAHLRLISVGGH